MQIDMGILSIAMSIMVAVFSALGRAALGARERELDGKISALHATAEDLGRRVAVEEKESIRQAGTIELIRVTHGDLKRDVEDIKSEMLTRTEYEPRMSSIEKSLSALITEIREMRSERTTGR
jgi:hypothetical protein